MIIAIIKSKNWCIPVFNIAQELKSVKNPTFDLRESYDYPTLIKYKNFLVR